jgi:hypothetical protein
MASTQHAICLATLLWVLTAIMMSEAAPLTSMRPMDFQQDKTDNCAESIDSCTSSETFYFDCPITCSKHLSKEFSMFKTKEAYQLYDMEVEKENGDLLEIENFEGYVFIYAVVPLLPGMGQFYYELLEHIRSVYQLSTTSVLLPVHVHDDDKSPAMKIQSHDESNSILLKESKEVPPGLMKYLTDSKHIVGSDETEISYDRVTIYMFSADGIFFQRLISPTLKALRSGIDIMLDVRNKDARDIRDEMGGEL